MKTFYKSLVLVAVAATALVSCNKEIEAPVEEKPVVKSHVEFFAESVAPSTKATLTTEDEKSFIAAWEVTDQVSLYAYNRDEFDEEKPATWNETKGAFEADFETATPAEKQAWMYKAKCPYSADGNIPFGGARVQNGNAYNSAYDIMYGTVDYTNALLGKDDNDNVFVIPMNRLTGIAYFHITGGPNNEDVVSATLEATGIAAENVTIASNGESVTASTGSETLDAITITFENGTAPKASDIKLWFNVIPGNYSGLTLTINTASKSAKLTSNKTMSYAAGKLNKAVLSGLKWNETLANAVFFEERFAESTGTMGWSGSAGNGTLKFDNTGWTSDNGYGAGGSAKFGAGSKLGSAQTPSITIGSAYANEDILLSFKAGAWDTSSESTTLKISATGATIVNDSKTAVSSVTMEKGAWTVYTLHLKSIESPITIKFEGNNTSNSRFFLDDVLVYYGEKPALSSLTVSPSEDQNVSYKAGSIDYTVDYTVDEVASTDWSVATSSDGFSVAKTTNGFTVTYSQNNGTERTGEIVVTAGTKTQTVKIIQAEKSLTDELTASKIGVSSYSNWSDVSDITGVTYAGNSTKSSRDEIQLRTKDNSGIVSTSTIGSIKKIVVDWGASLTVSRTLDIYGSNTAYESSADLYDNSKCGTKLGSLTFTDSATNETEFTVNGTYAYVGVRSNDSALYLNFIKFTYEEDNRVEPGMGWSASEATASITSSGVTFTAPKLTLGNASSVTYNSTEPSVATVESDGTVNVYAAGTTQIQAIFAGDATYKPSTKEYTLTVTDAREIVATPTFNPSAGEVVTNTVVTISSATQGATIYYTTDGSEPTTASTKGASVTITEDLTIKAIAVKDGYKDSEVASAAYIVTVPTVGSGTKDDPYTAGDILDKYPEGSGNTQVYVTGTITEITEVSTQFGNATYTISDGSRSILVYRGKYIDDAAFTSEDQIAVNDIVVVFGKIGVYSNAPQLAQNNYLISITADPNAPTLSVNPETTDASPAAWEADNNDAKEFTVTATNGTWSFNADDVSSWANVSRSGDILTVTPKEKQASEAHSGSIVITLTPSDSKYATKSATIYLSQKKYSAGGTPKTSTLTFTAKCNGSGTADDNVSWTVTSDGSESNFDDTKGIHYGTNSAQVTYIKLSTSGITGTITQVVVNASTASGVSATASVTVGGNAFGGNAQSLSTTASNYTFTGSAQGEIVVTVTKPSKAAKAIYVKSVIVTYNN